MRLDGIAGVALLPALLLAGAAALAQSTVLEVIPLRHRSAVEVIPIIQPMLAREGSVSGYQGQLVVRTTPANLEEIRRILAAVDTAPRQLLISVREDAAMARSRFEGGVSANVGGDHARVVIPPTGPDPHGGSVVAGEGGDRVRAHVLEGRATEGERDIQSVRVMEGREAFVRVGQSVPVRERQVQRTVVGGRVVERAVESSQYRDLASGFYVLARLSGDRVTLDISQQRAAPSGNVAGAAIIRGVVTVVSGRIGEWIEVGGLDRDAGSRQSVLLGGSTTAARESRRILIRVEEAR